MTILSMLSALALHSTAASLPPPIIDMHMHAWTLDEFGGESVPACVAAKGVEMVGADPGKPFDFTAQAECKVMIQSPATDEGVLAETLAQMRRFNIVAGVIAGERDTVAAWRKAHPERFIPAANFFRDDNPPPPERVAELEARVASGETRVFAEITPQYRGMKLDDSSLGPFWALAEKLDVPVGIHMGYGAPGGPYWAYPKYRATLGNPLLLEELLVRHPKMRVYVMHAGMPFTDEMIALLYSHPQVYVDISADNWGVARAEFHYQLKRLVDAGYGKRIMFGSDQMVWPQTIEVAIEAISEAPFLSENQKRDILYNNAARFLRLTQEEIDAHHGR